MKKLFFYSISMLSLASLFLLSSCSKIKDKLQTNITMKNADIEFTIPIISSTGTVSGGEENVLVNIDSLLKANNAEYAVNNIKSVHLKSCTISMVDGDANNNFSALEACNVSFHANTNTTDITLANVENNPDVESYNLSLPINTDIDFKDYFNATEFTYRFSGTARKTTTKEIHCKANIEYTLTVGL
ncbi:MAG: hypothetical protein R2831_09090 [Chitinophagaceae bacterium]